MLGNRADFGASASPQENANPNNQHPNDHFSSHQPQGHGVAVGPSSPSPSGGGAVLAAPPVSPVVTPLPPVGMVAGQHEQPWQWQQQQQQLHVQQHSTTDPPQVFAPAGRDLPHSPSSATGSSGFSSPGSPSSVDGGARNGHKRHASAPPEMENLACLTTPSSGGDGDHRQQQHPWSAGGGVGGGGGGRCRKRLRRMEDAFSTLSIASNNANAIAGSVMMPPLEQQQQPGAAAAARSAEAGAGPVISVRPPPHDDAASPSSMMPPASPHDRPRRSSKRRQQPIFFLDEHRDGYSIDEDDDDEHHHHHHPAAASVHAPAGAAGPTAVPPPLPITARAQERQYADPVDAKIEELIRMSRLRAELDAMKSRQPHHDSKQEQPHQRQQQQQQQQQTHRGGDAPPTTTAGGLEDVARSHMVYLDNHGKTVRSRSRDDFYLPPAELSSWKTPPGGMSGVVPTGDGGGGVVAHPQPIPSASVQAGAAPAGAVFPQHQYVAARAALPQQQGMQQQQQQQQSPPPQQQRPLTRSNSLPDISYEGPTGGNEDDHDMALD